ncbi:phage terminase large subunit-like protein [Angulomicrobium tetraedrale]|uniref:Phage terminase large subunit-like protein n=1 Tax=Ancylobacter tetraedralis TaxID=217068 RepID=A0A839Z8J7_9HYPH|nr:terminase family protein [Ancylobacter tetraedralis]MBB3769797.1 phage terminase large subunit-like protein [Ancylobacter tetraedralis]
MSACWQQGSLPDLLAALEADTAEWLLHHWPLIGRPAQHPPGAAQGGGDWLTWLVLGGRGAGKTRAGSEWVRALALGLGGPLMGPPAGRIALVAESLADLREVMVEGVSGILAVHPRRERPNWEPTRRRLEWPNGAVAQGFSADDPESLRGPQFDAAWCDELAKWRYAQSTFDMLQFGLRLGRRPRQMVTTTPRPTSLIRALLADPRTAVTRMGTAENAAHLAPTFLETVVGRYAGTRLGRQELDGELIEDRDDALWNRAAIEAARVAVAPPLVRLVVAVDPPASAQRHADACGIVAAGIDRDGLVHVLADESAQGLTPNGWGGRAIGLFHRLEADRVVVEVNQGGDMVRTILAGIDPAVPVTEVRATRGKWLRAEPVAALYEQGRVRHAGAFPALEDEMCDFGPEGLTSGRSPDRLDALVWAITALALGPREAAPRVRRI